MLDLRDFGPADPTGASPSDSALSAAIAAAMTAINPSAGVVDDCAILIPPGIWTMANPIALTSLPLPLRLVGAAAGGSILRLTGGAVHNITDGVIQKAAAAPSITVSGSSTNFTANTYVVLYTYYSGSGETYASNMTTLTISALAVPATVQVTAPGSLPSGYNGINVYVAYLDSGGTLHGGKVGSSSTGSTTATLSSFTLTGALPPSLTTSTSTPSRFV